MVAVFVQLVLLACVDDHLWILNPGTAQEDVIESRKNIPNIGKWHPTSECIVWYWMNVEQCIALQPLENQWNYDKCDTKKRFVCEGVAYEGKSQVLSS